jgi:hypothetical protein
MATLQHVTAAHAPTVDPKRTEELREFLDEWFIGTGAFEDITASVQVPAHSPRSGDENNPYIMLHGYASFGPVHRPSVRDGFREKLADDLDGLDNDEREGVLDEETEERCWDFAGTHTGDFLRGLSEFLTESFVVQTV